MPRPCTDRDPTVLCEARDYLVNGKGLAWALSIGGCATWLRPSQCVTLLGSPAESPPS